MASYVNEARISRLSTVEIEPFTIQFDDLDDSAVNVLVSAKRFNTATASDAGTDISTKVSISGNEVSVVNIWLGADTPAAGNYRIQVVVRDPATLEKYEVNAYIEVV